MIIRPRSVFLLPYSLSFSSLSVSLSGGNFFNRDSFRPTNSDQYFRDDARLYPVWVLAGCGGFRRIHAGDGCPDLYHRLNKCANLYERWRYRCWRQRQLCPGRSVTGIFYRQPDTRYGFRPAQFCLWADHEFLPLYSEYVLCFGTRRGTSTDLTEL